jgi:hypothetical protein
VTLSIDFLSEFDAEAFGKKFQKKYTFVVRLESFRPWKPKVKDF